MTRSRSFWQGRLDSLFVGLLCVLTLAFESHAQHDHHHDGSAATEQVSKPRVFLDKSPRIVAYQLKRLDNQRLLLVDREPNDPKYAPVYSAILLRAGMSPQYRREALEGLVAIHRSSPAKEIQDATATLKPTDRQEQRTAKELANLLLTETPKRLAGEAETFAGAVESDNSLVRLVGYAGFIATGQGDQALGLAKASGQTKEFLTAVSLVPQVETRNVMRPQLLAFIGPAHGKEIRLAAIEALQYTSADQEETFRLVAPYVRDPAFRDAAVSTLRKIPAKQRDAETSKGLLSFLVDLAEQTPAAQRTSDSFLNAMQLADQLLSRVPPDMARNFRQRLGDVTVRVVMIHTVEEEMRYDVPYFAVAAGKPVQVVLKNEDLMPHNLVFVAPGSLQEIAELGLAAGPQGHNGKEYVPNDDRVLFATNMVAPMKQARLTFTAPTEPGEYPFVCTFPRHWMRMYGVMIVVDDVDAWLANPVAPADPIGSNRPLIQSWKLADLEGELDQGMRGRSKEIGQRIFQEATCAQCHKANGVGGAVGPELTDVLPRWKGDRVAVLHEILDPSHRIDAKYAMHLVITVDGNTISGIVAEEGKQSVSLLTNPESKELTVIPRSDIEEMVKTSTSMMPKGLLDRFTKDEIFELMAYLESLEKTKTTTVPEAESAK